MGRRKLCRILLESSPDLNLTNQQKETPLQIAERKGHDEIADVIRNPPPKPPPQQQLVKKGSGVEIADGVEVIEEATGGAERRRDNRAKKGKGQHHSKSPRRNKHGHRPVDPSWSPYGCHYYPDPTEFPDPDPASLPDEPLRAGEQYYLDLAGKIQKGPVGSGYTCYCAPIISRVEKKMDRNKKEVFRHLDLTHGKLSSRITNLERKTRDQLSGLSNSMKETFAQERLECHDRMDRRAIRDRINIERHQAVRDMMLRGDLSAWLETRVNDLEKSSAMRNSEDAAFMRTLLRSSKRRKRAFWSELQSGTLRRAASEECLAGEGQEVTLESQNAEGSGPPEPLWPQGEAVAATAGGGRGELRVSDHPQQQQQSIHPGAVTAAPELSPSSQPNHHGVRVRRNSAGDESHLLTAPGAFDFGDFNAREIFGGAPQAQPAQPQAPVMPTASQKKEFDAAPLYQNNQQLMMQVVETPAHSAGSSGVASAQLPHFHQDVTSYSTNSESQSYHGSSHGHPSSISDRGSAVNSPHFGNNWPPAPSAAVGPQLHHQQNPPVPPIKPALKDTSTVIYQNFNHVQRPIPLSGAPQPNRPFYGNGGVVGPPPLLPKQIVPPPYRPPPATASFGLQPLRPTFVPSANTQQQPGNLDAYVMGSHPPLMGFSKTTSDGGGSHDSHNDSGYCPRVGGGSGGPSPSLSGSQGRPDSAGPHDQQPSSLTSLRSLPSHQPQAASATSVGPRIRQLQQQLSLARLGGGEEGEGKPPSAEPKGSLV